MKGYSMTSTNNSHNSNSSGLDELNWKMTKLIENFEANTKKVEDIYTALFISTTTKDSILETLKKHDSELKTNKDAYVNHIKKEHNALKTVWGQILSTTINTIVAGLLIWAGSVFVLGIDKKFEVKFNQVNPPAQVQTIDK